MENKTNDGSQAWIGFVILLGGAWVAAPIVDLLRKGFGSSVAGSLFEEAIGRAMIVLFGGGLVAWALDAITGRKKATPPH